MVDLRSHPRVAFDVAVEFVIKGSGDRIAGHCKDVSLGGMFIQTTRPLPFGSGLVVHVTLPGQKTSLAIPGVVRWSKPGEGMGVQFGLMGARDTHAITELTRLAAEGRDPSRKISS